MARTLWYLGYLNLSLQWSNETRNLAKQLSHPHSVAQALYQVALIHSRRREVDIVQELAEKLINYATEHGFGILVSMGNFLRGKMMVEQGQGEDGLEQMRQGLKDLLARGAVLVWITNLIDLAEAYGKMGQIEEGLNALTEVRAAIKKSGQYFLETRIYQLNGELLLQTSIPETSRAEACFHHALVMSQKHEAKYWELQTAMSLSRLWLNQGKKEDARGLLSEIYNWFTEGFDTADLKDAKSLIEELS
jgi:predicted ATPase